MPIYDYKCNTCNKTYDVFHKGREVLDDVICPSCESKEHARLIFDLRREISALSDALAGMRREQRESNVRLYERWERIAERVAKLEGARANGVEG